MVESNKQRPRDTSNNNMVTPRTSRSSTSRINPMRLVRSSHSWCNSVAYPPPSRDQPFNIGFFPTTSCVRILNRKFPTPSKDYIVGFTQPWAFLWGHVKQCIGSFFVVQQGHLHLNLLLPWSTSISNVVTRTSSSPSHSAPLLMMLSSPLACCIWFWLLGVALALP